MLTIDLESGLPLFLQDGYVLREEGIIANPLCLESGLPLFTESLLRFVV